MAGTLRIAEHAVCLCVEGRFPGEWSRISGLFDDRVGKLGFFLNGSGGTLPLSAYRFIHGPVPPTWRAATNAYWCYLGILDIVRFAKTAGWPEVLLIEDDCDLTADFDDVVAKALDQLGDIKPELLYLGANHIDATTVAVGPNVWRVEGSYTTHCVLIRASVYDSILALTPDDAIDWQIAHKIHPRHGCYAVWPNVAVQKAGYSTILGRHADYAECWQNTGRHLSP